MQDGKQSSLGLGVKLLFCGVVFAGLSLGSQQAAAQACKLNSDGSGMCKSEGNQKCSPPTGGYCYSTHNKSEWTCVCATTKPVTMDTPSDTQTETPPEAQPRTESHDGPHIGIGIGIGFGGVSIDVGSGGYCDHWGCPGNYWDEPVFYGPVYFDGDWYDGPIYYRDVNGHSEYWVHGGWHEDEWKGDRPDWARDTHKGPALGKDYYKSDEFKHWKENHPGHHDDDKGKDNKNGKDDKWDKDNKGH